ncbi:MAG: hypothetical protein ACK4IK_02685 [Bacteroidia bacterium]
MKRFFIILCFIVITNKLHAYPNNIGDKDSLDKKTNILYFLTSGNIRLLPNYNTVFFNPFKSSLGYNFNAGIGININTKSFVNLSIGLVKDYYKVTFNEYIINQFQIKLDYKPTYISLPNLSCHHILFKTNYNKLFIGIGINRDILFKHEGSSGYDDGIINRVTKINERFGLKENIFFNKNNLTYFNVPLNFEHTINNKVILSPTIEYKYCVNGALYNGFLYNGHHYWNVGVAMKI